VGYLNAVSRFRLFPYAAAAIRRLKEAGFAVVVVTNQSGVARGYFPESLVHEVHEIMSRELAEGHACVDGVYYCPHSSADNCGCRKPKTGMIERAAREHALDLQRAFVVGDRYGDVELAFRVGARGILVRSGYGEGEWNWHRREWARRPDYVAEDLSQAVDWILRQER
jgi:D-glycero-D-manno-heptose 1,7-bisphosphate phosphatase